MIPDVHVVPTRARRRPDQCHWTWHWEDVDLRCDEHAMPGSHLCADHLIEKERRRAHGQSD